MNEWNEWKCIDFKCVRKLTKSRLSLTHLVTLNSPRVRGISPVGKAEVYGWNDLPKNQVLSSEWKTERVREYASGESKDGEDDELPCVIGESDNRFKGFGSLRGQNLPFSYAYCPTCDSTKHRKMANFNPSGSQNPGTDFDETWHG